MACMTSESYLLLPSYFVWSYVELANGRKCLCLQSVRFASTAFAKIIRCSLKNTTRTVTCFVALQVSRSLRVLQLAASCCILPHLAASCRILPHLAASCRMSCGALWSIWSDRRARKRVDKFKDSQLKRLNPCIEKVSLYHVASSCILMQSGAAGSASSKRPWAGHWTAHVSCLNSRTHILTLLNFAQVIRDIRGPWLDTWWMLMGLPRILSWPELSKAAPFAHLAHLALQSSERQEPGWNETERVLQNMSKHDPIHQTCIKHVQRSKSNSYPQVRPAARQLLPGLSCIRERNTQFWLVYLRKIPRLNQ